MPILPEITHTDEPTISPSQITTYLMCSLKFRFTYIDKIPRPWKSSALAFGSAVHSALEAWQMSRLSGEEMPAEEVVRTFLADWESEKAGGVKFTDDEEIYSLADRGKTLVKLAVDALAPERPEAVELPFAVDLPRRQAGLGKWDIDVPPPKLRGVFDLLLPDDRLVEIKTTGRRYDRDTLERHVQISAYAFAYERLMGRPAKLEVLTLLKTKVPKVERLGTHRTREAQDWFVHLALGVFRSIQNNSFFPNPSFLCGDCEFAENCREWRG